MILNSIKIIDLISKVISGYMINKSHNITNNMMILNLFKTYYIFLKIVINYI